MFFSLTRTICTISWARSVQISWGGHFWNLQTKGNKMVSSDMQKSHKWDKRVCLKTENLSILTWQVCSVGWLQLRQVTPISFWHPEGPQKSKTVAGSSRTILVISHSKLGPNQLGGGCVESPKCVQASHQVRSTKNCFLRHTRLSHFVFFGRSEVTQLK